MASGVLANRAILVLAGFVGFAVISKVPNTLHTPLMSGTNVVALADQRGVDAPVPVRRVGLLENRLDEHGQLLAPAGGRRGRAVVPLVIARRGHVQPRAHFDDRILRLLRIDERELLAHRYSCAKKAAGRVARGNFTPGLSQNRA